ncbi:gamma-glutamyl-gamma-aminobutyrate hydrolase family protein [Peptoniphilus sp. KCTC 25270]|uniref:gamma-glutamyl-gamma-aminobutyrate hydrolase family protein n=1 Tax=Peptoniphilus sp. KCTC 25270 TaxID=2897414 RepID=UPI001E6300A2|nr:gamma-glutamyl-gamma-aminobutyrate hydrolase family protein [Peptoniphilus sp. KCTC 25270]MCD1147610.1 gamma-glutamyl-gamma-aminobutyrate hydrolase family protein [Peptoniphilus sp. KCTC 25270]
MKPLIGVAPYYSEKNNKLYISREVLDAVVFAGGIPMLLPFVEEFKIEDFESILERCDGFLFTGGHDFPAEHYGEENGDKIGPFAPPRDILEFGLLPHILERDIPVLGICRGMQLINVVKGGSLHQDLTPDCGACISHEVRDTPYYQCVHKVSVKNKDLKTDFFGCNDLEVNSLHHQAVKEMGEGLVDLLWSEDGFIEALYGPEYRYLVGVQWHPEYLYNQDEANGHLFRSFVKAAQEYREEIKGEKNETL